MAAVNLAQVNLGRLRHPIDDHRPTVDEALARLSHLRRYGPTPQAFTARTRWDPEGRPESVRTGR